MKTTRLCLLLCAVLALAAPTLGASPRRAIGTAVGAGAIRVDGVTLPSGVVFYSGDRISTTSAEASLYFAKGAELTLGPSTAVQVKGTSTAVVAQLEHGTIAAFNGRQSRMIVSASGITIESQKTGGSYEVVFAGNRLHVVTRRGVTLVADAKRSLAVPAGHLLQAKVGPGAAGGAVGNLLTVVVIAAAATAGTALAVAASSPGPACVSSSQLNCP